MVLALALLLFAMLLVATLPARSPRPPVGNGSGSASADANPSVAGLPSALRAPFDARSGYDPSLRAESRALRPTSSSIEVDLTFWPRSNAFFGPPPWAARSGSVRDIAETYGISNATANLVRAYFTSQGLTVGPLWPDRLGVTIEGPAGRIDRAFATTLEDGTLQGRSDRFPLSPPALPPPVADVISSVTGLESGTGFEAPLSAPSEASGPAAGALGPNLVTPTIAHSIYDVDPLYNASGGPHYANGTGIALILWGDGYDPADLATFYRNYYPPAFPAPTIRPYPVDGAPAPSAAAVDDPSGGSVELTLDLEWAGSMAPGATLDAVYAPNGPSPDFSPSDTDMEDALRTAVQSIAGVDVISMSFGALDGSDLAFQAAYSELFSEASDRGMTLVASSGDNGGDADASCSGGPAPQFPAASPDVLAVGGTDPTIARNVFGGFTGLADEPAWNLSGGGFSTSYRAPSWQLVGSAGSVVGANGDRGIPDVAAASAYDFLYFDGAPGARAGTSFAAPLWAGLIAEMDALRGTSFGFLTPRLYAVGAGEEAGRDAIGLADVTAGSNCVARASAGWDAVTGWGSPRGLLLYDDLSATFVGLGLSAGPDPAAPGGTVTLTTVVTNLSSHRPIANLSVALTLTSQGLPSPCDGTFGAAAVTTNASGVATAALSIPGCYLGGHAIATAQISSSGYFGTNSTVVGVNLLGWGGLSVLLAPFPYDVIEFSILLTAATALGVYLGDRRRRPRASAPPVTLPADRAGAPSDGSDESASNDREAPAVPPGAIG